MEKYKKEPERWVTINGNHVPVFSGGSLGSDKETDTPASEERRDYKQVMHEQDRKSTVRQAKADAKKAEKKFHDLHTVSIEDILLRMGYSKDSFYVYKKRVHPASGSFSIMLDFYDLVHKHDGHIKVEVKE